MSEQTFHLKLFHAYIQLRFSWSHNFSTERQSSKINKSRDVTSACSVLNFQTFHFTVYYGWVLSVSVVVPKRKLWKLQQFRKREVERLPKVLKSSASFVPVLFFWRDNISDPSTLKSNSQSTPMTSRRQFSRWSLPSGRNSCADSKPRVMSKLFRRKHCKWSSCGIFCWGTWFRQMNWERFPWNLGQVCCPSNGCKC